DLPGTRDGAVHLLGFGRQHQLGAEGLEQLPAFEAHALRHREHAAVAAARAHEREPDARVAARGLDHGAGRGEPPLAFGAKEHRETDAILDGAAGVLRLELAEDAGTRRPSGEVLDLDERRIANQIEDAREDQRMFWQRWELVFR